MRFKIVCLILLHYLASSWCLMNFRSQYLVTKKMPNVQKNSQQNVRNAIEEDSAKIEFPVKNPEIVTKVEKGNEIFFEKTNIGNSYGNDSTFFSDIILHIADSGHLMLKSLENHIHNQLKLIKSPKISILQDIEDQYYDILEEYAIFMDRQMVKCELEREFYILDFIDSANKILANQSFLLLTKMSQFCENSALEDDVARLSTYIRKAVIIEKTNSFAYICHSVNICRRFPAYSDRIAEILNEVLILPDTKFQAFITLLKDIIVMKETFLNKNMVDDIELTRNFTSKLSYLNNNITEAKNVFTTLKRIINHRHKIFKSKNGQIKRRKKALRILIDLLDKSFETVTENFIRTEGNNVINGLRAWAESGRINMQKILVEFFDNIEMCLAPFLGMPGVTIELKTLTDLIVKGTSKHNIVVGDYLLTKGSKFVNYG